MSEGVDGDANGMSFDADISGNGQWVAFSSYASNLLESSADTNGQLDVFVRQVPYGPTVRVSVGDNNEELMLASFGPSISYDGRFVAFATRSTTLTTDPNVLLVTNDHVDVFVRDRDYDENGVFDELDTGEVKKTATIYISVASNGSTANGDSFPPTISADGRFVGFTSDATNMEPGGGTDPYTKVYVRDLHTGQTRRINTAASGGSPNDWSILPVLSYDGRFVAFESAATNLVSDPDTNSAIDTFVRDRGIQLPGDLNGDGIVDDADFAIIQQFEVLSQGQDGCPCCAADLNGDDVVDELDRQILCDNWSSGTPPCEP